MKMKKTKLSNFTKKLLKKWSINLPLLKVCLLLGNFILIVKIHIKFFILTDTATSPVHFNTGISIRQELDPEKLLKLKSPCDEMKIDASKIDENGEKINNSR